MQVTIYQEPCILLEAVELVYAWVNQIPVEQLAPANEFSMPVDEMLRIRDAVCQGLDPEDPELQFFFRGVPLSGDQGRMTCIARCLVYNTLELSCPDPDDMAKALSRAWNEMSEPIIVAGMDQYSVGFTLGSPGEFIPLSREIAKLPLPTAYQLQLLDAFSHFEQYLCRLVDLLRPGMEKLPQLLKPWLLRARPVLNRWREFLTAGDVTEYFYHEFRMKIPVPDVIEIALHHFLPKAAMVHVLESGGVARLLISIDMNIGQGKRKKEDSLSDGEYTALRLIASPDRVAMLHAMMDEPMSGQELIQKLGLNSGSVFRDLNSMTNANLLIREVDNGKRTYRTNYTLLHSLFHRTLRVIAPKEEA